MVRFNLAVTLLVVALSDFVAAREKGLQSPSRRLKDGDDGGSGDSCNDETNFPNDCARTLPDFMINLLKLGFDEDTLVNSGFGFGCNFDVDAEWDRLCCSASAMRATLGFTWQSFLDFGGSANVNDADPCGPFIPSTLDKPNWLQSFAEAYVDIDGDRRRMEEGSSKPVRSEAEDFLQDFFDMDEMPHALDRMFKDDDMRRHLGVPDEVIAEATRRGRKLQLEGLGEFESDDGAICLLTVVFAGFVEFWINEDIGGGGQTNPIGAGVADFIKNLGCDFSGLLTQRCEDWAPQVDLGDLSGFDEVVRGYIGAELSFTVCKLVKEAIAAFSLFIFSPWLLPACYCNYKHEVGCNIESCYDPVDSECCLAGETSPAPTEAPAPKWQAKPDLVDDVTVAYGRYFPYVPFTALLRACNAKPGPGTYFAVRLPNGQVGDFPFGPNGDGTIFRLRDFFDRTSNSGSPKGKGGMSALSPEEQFLKDIGECANGYDPSEEYSYLDGINLYELIESTGGDDSSAACPVECVQECMVDSKGYSIVAFREGVEDLNDFADGSDFIRAGLAALAFYYAQGGTLDDIAGESFEEFIAGLLEELLGEDLLQGLLDLELGGGLFPVRRGGQPLDKCLGFCFLQGSLANIEGFGGGLCPN